MAQNYKRDLGLNKINTMLEVLEKNPNRTEEEILKAKNNFELIKKIKNYSEDDLKEFEDRFATLSNIEISTDAPELETAEEIQKLSSISPRSKKVNSNGIRVAVAALATGAVIGIAGYTLTSCGNTTEPKVITIEKIPEVVEPVAEEVKFTEMSKETKEYADNIVLAMNDAISKGFEVTETNKEIMSKKFVNYMNIINMDVLTKEQWETFYQDGNITGKDMMYDLFDIETIFEKIITVSENENEVIDFSLYFNETDAGLLNKAESMIIKINTSKDNDRNVAINEMHKFIIDTLTLTENRMQYSEVALNTFRGVFVNAFDVLSNGKSITDEEEHAIFTVATHCMGSYDNNIKVEDQTINSLQSKFEIYMTEKADKMLEKKLDIEVNPYDSFNEISIYVANNIDLSLYKPAKDYVEYQKKLFLGDGNNKKSTVVKAKNDSGVSDGKGGVISTAQFAKYGIDPRDPNAKGKLESAVVAEYEAEAERNKKTLDTSGNYVADPELLNKYTQQGADDYNYKRGYNISLVPSEYQNAYQNGWDNAKMCEEEARRNLQSLQPTYVESYGSESQIINETITEQPYTGNVETYGEQTYTGSEVYEEQSYVDPEPIVTYEEQGYIEEFVPIEGNNSSSESVEEINYTSSIKVLKELKQELLNLSTNYIVEEKHQKC